MKIDNFIKINFKIFYLWISLLMLSVSAQQTSNSMYGDSLCIQYINNFKPIYWDGQDSLVVATLPIVKQELQEYLNESLIKNDFSCLKYSYIIIRLMIKEHYEVNGTSYLINDLERRNGFIKLALHFMAKIDDNSDIEFSYEYFYLDIYNWLKEHHSEIKEYRIAKKYLKKKIKNKKPIDLYEEVIK